MTRSLWVAATIGFSTGLAGQMPSMAQTTIPSSADTFVRDGVFGNDNYGMGPNLILKWDTAIGFHRKAYCRFDLTGLNADPSMPAKSNRKAMQSHGLAR
jgi:hypothetical protein